MEIIELKASPFQDESHKSNAPYLRLEQLLTELRIRGLSDESILAINRWMAPLNTTLWADEKKYFRALLSTYTSILKLIEKNHKLVVKNHYRNLWMTLGMAIIGIPIGITLGVILGNLGFMGLGFPIGMGLGIAFGASMDHKAAETGRQLNL